MFFQTPCAFRNLTGLLQLMAKEIFGNVNLEKSKTIWFPLKFIYSVQKALLFQTFDQ